MIIYNYDAATGEYTGEGRADASPLERGVYLVPAHATTIAPPAAVIGHARVWGGAAWEQIEDHRGETVYATSTGAAQKITALGPLPPDVTRTAPREHQAWDVTAMVWVDDAAALATAARIKRDAALTACEWLVIRHRDQTDAGMVTTLTPAQYADLLTYRQALRDVPEQAGFPRNVDWPVVPGA